MTAARYRLDEMREQAPLNGLPCHEWKMPHGQLWLTIHRCNGGFVLRFPGLADFEVDDDGLEARCAPVPGTPAQAHEHLYLNQVLPLMLSRQGKMVFHASAVALTDGVVAFIGESGRGKSTLAAAFATAGTRFLADDGMVLEEAAYGYRVLPSHASIRLRADSRRALLGSDRDTARGADDSGKMRLLARARLPHCDEARTLLAAYFLGDGASQAITMKRLHGTEALMAWVRHAFMLDVDDSAWLAGHFAAVTRLTEAVPCYHLDYPRRFEVLDRLRRAIDEHEHPSRRCA